MAATVAAKNRKVRQEALRDQLKAQGHLQHVVEIAKEFREQGAGMETSEITTKKHAADIHLRLINKYLPDLKAMELTGDGGGEIGIDQLLTVEFVGIENKTT
jgi:hypothetical protein